MLWKSLERVDGEGFPSPCQELETIEYSNFNDFEGYYALLGVSPLSSFVEIKHAYRKRVKELHPDKNGDITEYHAVVKAYKTLSSPLKRNEYDRQKEPQFDGKSLLIRQAMAGNVRLPIIDPVTVGVKRYTYYQGKGEEADYNVILEWYQHLIEVFNLFGIEDRPRVALHNLGETYSWSKINSKSQIAHFDNTIKPSFIVALAATLKSDKIKRKGN